MQSLIIAVALAVVSLKKEISVQPPTATITAPIKNHKRTLFIAPFILQQILIQAAIILHLHGSQSPTE